MRRKKCLHIHKNTYVIDEIGSGLGGEKRRSYYVQEDRKVD